MSYFLGSFNSLLFLESERTFKWNSHFKQIYVEFYLGQLQLNQPGQIFGNVFNSLKKFGPVCMQVGI